MKYSLTLLLVLLIQLGYSQKIRFVQMNPEAFRHDNVKGFNYLHEDMPADSYFWIGDINIEIDTILPGTIIDLYNHLAKKANRLGSNAFRVKDSDIFAFGEDKKIEIELFYLHRENSTENMNRFHSNRVYIFGFLGYHEKIGGYKIMINEEKYLMESLRYKVFELPEGQVMRIKLYNGFGSTTEYLFGEEDPVCHYYRFNLIKRFFTHGAIREYEWSFGQFLIRILPETKEVLPILK